MIGAGSGDVSGDVVVWFNAKASRTEVTTRSTSIDAQAMVLTLLHFVVAVCPSLQKKYIQVSRKTTAVHVRAANKYRQLVIL